ncbi:hypothetical protein EIP91_007935 [Steccherinum ochraceum]|uniref:Protein-S-isoprenylcysteine O-methyltransferase n=1 Tax=Steccherinum ochraceum TaxID=92696 RepID=A0A4R0RUF9_9APHY|nr:hypothetical protein EIP91_007935 [Steccherinum ochraceum]
MSKLSLNTVAPFVGPDFKHPSTYESKMIDASVFIVAMMTANTLCVDSTSRRPKPVPLKSELKKYKARKETADAWSVSFLTVVQFVLLTINLGFGGFLVWASLSSLYPTFPAPFLQSVATPKPGQLYLSTTFVVASLCVYAGTIIRSLAMHALGRLFVPELAIKNDHKLITTGAYAIVRHPAYAGFDLQFGGLIVSELFSPGTWWWESGMWHSWQGMAFGGFWTGYWIFMFVSGMVRVAKEDAVMKIEFMEQWERWHKATPYALFPGIF